jgi:hypothetical protein
MYVCLCTKIGLFLTGAPGQSKSLSLNLILYCLNHTGINDCYIRLLPEFCPKFF